MENKKRENNLIMPAIAGMSGATLVSMSKKDRELAKETLKKSNMNKVTAGASALGSGLFGIHGVHQKKFIKPFLPPTQVELSSLDYGVSAGLGAKSVADFSKSKKQKEAAKKLLKSSELNKRLGVAGLGIGAGGALLNSLNKESSLSSYEGEKIASNKDIAKDISRRLTSRNEIKKAKIDNNRLMLGLAGLSAGELLSNIQGVNLMKTAFERLDEAIEKVAERKEKLSKGQKVFISGVGAGALGSPLLLSSTAGYNKATVDASVLKLQKNLPINNIAKKKKLARALKAAQIKQIAGASGMALGGAASYASLPIMLTGGAIMFGERNNMNKEAFETVDEAIEKVAERDNKRVAGNATGAMLLGAGGTGLYYANKDKAIAEAAAKKAKSFKNGAKSRAGLTGLGALGTGAGIADKYSKNKSLGKALKGEAGGIALTALAGGATVSAAKKQKASQELAERAFKSSKLKGAGGAIGLGLGAGTLLASNKKKNQ